MMNREWSVITLVGSGTRFIVPMVVGMTNKIVDPEILRVDDVLQKNQEV